MSAGVEDEAQARAPGSEEYDVARLLTFSDGVFAIAITLLVLSIPGLPSLSPEEAPRRLAGELLKLAPNLTAFVVSFVFVGLYWIRHHRLLRGVRRAPPALLWLNLLVLLFVCLLPFSTGVVSHYGYTTIGSEVYAANLVLLGLSFFLVSLHLVAGGQVPRYIVVRAGVFTLIFLLSMLVALWQVWGAWAIWTFSALVGRILDRTPAVRSGAG
jgi:uncharacterized membrane protein